MCKYSKVRNKVGFQTNRTYTLSFIYESLVNMAEPCYLIDSLIWINAIGIVCSDEFLSDVYSTTGYCACTCEVHNKRGANSKKKHIVSLYIKRQSCGSNAQWHIKL